MVQTIQLCPPPVPVSKRQEAIRRTRKAYPDAFVTQEGARFYLLQIIMGPSRRWGFISVAKNASSSTKHLLFQAEFGSKMTTQITPRDDINPAATIHMIAEHRLFTNALYQGMGAGDVLGPDGPDERICVLRNPFDRALSSYRYICRSHAEKSRWFGGDRLRINAVTGFDWDRHPGTLDGFHRFLDYIAWQIEVEGVEKVDAHWRPQVDFIKPALFQPTIIGRMEDMAPYWRTLSERFDVPLDAGGPWENRQPPAPDALAADKAARARVETVYAVDYEAFGY